MPVDSPIEADLLIRPRWVVPVEPVDAVLEDHAIVVDGGRIVALLPATDAARRYRARLTLDRPDHALMPGLVNAHTHASMSLLRGFADDLPLETWLSRHIWPAESRWADAEFVRDGTRLAMLEMIRGGTTCFNDMYFFPDVVADLALEHGMRASIGMIIMEQPTPWAASPEEYFSKGLAVHDQYRQHPLVTTTFAPHAPYSVSDDTLARLRRLADELDAPVHMHVHETRKEIEAADAAGERPLARLDRLKLLSASFMAVHMTQLTAADIELAASRNISVVHCPSSNLKLASGFCPVAALTGRGINVAIGTDGAASNNRLDMLEEMRTTALLAKGVAGDASALPAGRALAMATMHGARALGLAEEIGSLAPGKWADMVCVNLAEAGTWPVHHVVSQLVYAASRSQVSDVWVAGRELLRNGEPVTLDPRETLERAARWRGRLAA